MTGKELRNRTARWLIWWKLIFVWLPRTKIVTQDHYTLPKISANYLVLVWCRCVCTEATENIHASGRNEGTVKFAWLIVFSCLFIYFLQCIILNFKFCLFPHAFVFTSSVDQNFRIKWKNQRTKFVMKLLQDPKIPHFSSHRSWLGDVKTF